MEVINTSRRLWGSLKRRIPLVQSKAQMVSQRLTTLTLKTVSIMFFKVLEAVSHAKLLVWSSLRRGQIAPSEYYDTLVSFLNRCSFAVANSGL
jgi:predicted component of type VI protein secretion system